MDDDLYLVEVVHGDSLVDPVEPGRVVGREEGGGEPECNVCT